MSAKRAAHCKSYHKNLHSAAKIIEKDKNRAEAMAKTLPKAVVLHGDASDHELLSEEGIEKTDAFVALTGLDEGNILSALYAKRKDGQMPVLFILGWISQRSGPDRKP